MRPLHLLAALGACMGCRHVDDYAKASSASKPVTMASKVEEQVTTWTLTKTPPGSLPEGRILGVADGKVFVASSRGIERTTLGAQVVEQAWAFSDRDTEQDLRNAPGTSVWTSGGDTYVCYTMGRLFRDQVLVLDADRDVVGTQDKPTVDTLVHPLAKTVLRACPTKDAVYWFGMNTVARTPVMGPWTRSDLCYCHPRSQLLDLVSDDAGSVFALESRLSGRLGQSDLVLATIVNADRGEWLTTVPAAKSGPWRGVVILGSQQFVYGPGRMLTRARGDAQWADVPVGDASIAAVWRLSQDTALAADNKGQEAWLLQR